MAAKVERNCERCGKPFTALLKEVKKGWGRFCSRQCVNMKESPAEMIGKQFGRWTVVSYAGSALWNCKCECGTEKPVDRMNLLNATSTSCGCLAKEMFVARHVTHGMTGTPEWHAWRSMRYRCLNPSCKAFHNYGGRGIAICNRWLDSFDNFYADMGPRPDGCSLDRIDSNGNYEPSNCRWATRIQQEHNKRSNRILVFRGDSLPLSEMARKFGLSPGTLGDRLSYGWDLEKALLTPTRKRKAHHGNRRSA